MKNGWTLEWYIEHQFSNEVKRTYREQTEGAGQRAIYAALIAMEVC